ncbi:ATP-dependent endonuclease, partial [Escherichia coli]|nr:ATP-dependent endonuclease [Escherichia coli]
VAASKGCSKDISDGWEGMSYRMSILPAESFFSNGVFLIEGPSEVLFYHSLAENLNINLDYLNISLVSVDGISFKIYVAILDALEIPWVMRTDNDISKLKDQEKWQYSGINRCLDIVGLEKFEHSDIQIVPIDTLTSGDWQTVSEEINKRGVYLSKVDLETDLVGELSAPILNALGKKNDQGAIEYLQKKKALRMRELLKDIKTDLHKLNAGELVKPLNHLVKIIRGE